MKIDILKIADINAIDLGTFAEFISENVTPVYTDNEMHEHLYNPTNILDEISEGFLQCSITQIEQLENIQAVCDKNNCAYFRITF